MNQNYFNDKAQGLTIAIFLFMIIAFIIVIISVLYVYMGNIVKTELKEANIKTSGNWTEIVDNSMGGVVNAYGTLNWLTTFLILGYVLAILIGSYFANEHPIAFLLCIFINVIAIIISIPLANAYYNLYLNTTLNPTFLGFESSSYILFHLPVFTIVITLISSTIIVIRLTRRSKEV